MTRFTARQTPLHPSTLPGRQSPIHDELARLRPRWSALDGMPVPAGFGDPAREAKVAGTLGLCDTSALTRMTIKGPAALEWLTSQGLWVPDQVYGHLRQASGGTIVRTGSAECSIEDGWRGGAVERLRRALDAGVPGVYGVVRQDLSLVISGSAALELFAQTCSYNFANSGFRFVMTQMAGVSVSVLPRQLGAARCWQLWADGSYGVYLWETLLEIARELGGDAVGVEQWLEWL